jgi:hypothetical protein
VQRLAHVADEMQQEFQGVEPLLGIRPGRLQLGGELGPALADRWLKFLGGAFGIGRRSATSAVEGTAVEGRCGAVLSLLTQLGHSVTLVTSVRVMAPQRPAFPSAAISAAGLGPTRRTSLIKRPLKKATPEKQSRRVFAGRFCFGRRDSLRDASIAV